MKNTKATFNRNKLKKLLPFAIIIFLLFDFVLISKRVKPQSFVGEFLLVPF